MNQPAQTGKHPKGLYVLFFTEMWERFGYYLMVGILFLFMTNSTGHTSIKVYSMEGKEVAMLYNANTQAGEIYQVTLDGSNLPSGMYFVEMTNANGKKMLVKAMISY